jgi:hypothetical protein
MILVLGLYICVHKESEASWMPASAKRNSHSSGKVDFATEVRPILEKGCKPCHFAGGVMYERMPFDRPETIKRLGTKLFTRIKDENERRPIRDFLTQR